MKTLYLTDSSSNIYVDTETNEVGKLSREDRYDIRDVYYIEEPMHVVYQSGETTDELDVKKGDILLMFYNNRFNKYVLEAIKAKRWTSNIKNKRAIEQKEKEEWASRNLTACGTACGGECDECDACDCKGC